MRGTQARAYGTSLDGKVPDSLTRFVQEAMEAACTFYEDEFNDGKPFPPATLSAGPGATGAREGAAKRVAAAREKAERPDDGEAQPSESTRRRRAGAARS